jgi:pilus assembly protein Flp/PilA
MIKLLTRVARDKTGATAVEYGLIAALVAMALVSALVALAGKAGGSSAG